MNTPGYNDNIVYLPINPDEEQFPTATGNITINSNIITNITDTSIIEINSYVEGAGIPVSKVLSKTANSITIQNNCTATNINIDFTIYKVDFTYDTPNKYYDFETLIISEPGLLPDGIDLTITLPPLVAFETQNFGELQINHNPNVIYQTTNKTIIKVPTGYFLDGVQDGILETDIPGDVVRIFNPFFTRINDKGVYNCIIEKRYWDNKQDPINNPNGINTNKLLKVGSDNYSAVSQYNEDTISNIITRLNNGGGVGSGQIYYLNATNITLNSIIYKTLSAIPPVGVLTTKTVIINNNTQLIEQFVTPVLNKFNLSSGIWTFNIKSGASKTPTGDVLKLYVEVYQYLSNNTTNLLYSIIPATNNLTTDIIEVSLETAKQSYSINNTDRLLIKLFATTTHTQDITVTLQYNSDTAISHMHTPLIEEISDYLQTNTNQDIILGLQESGATGVTVEVKGQTMTGTDIQAPNINITTPLSTGNKDAGNLVFKSAIRGVSGTNTNTAIEVARITKQGIESKMLISQKLDVTSAGSTITLTTNDNSFIEATGSLFCNFKLPNATLLSKGSNYLFINNTSVSMNIFNDSSAVIYTITPSTYKLIILDDNSTANGVWYLLQQSQSKYLQTNTNNDIIIGNQESGATGANIVIKGQAKTGNDAIGDNISIYASNGTGGGGGGTIDIYTAPSESNIVSLGTASANSASTNTNALTFSHTVPTGNNRFLLVQLSCGASAQANSVTFGGTALTLISRVASTSQKIESWGLIAPSQTTANIVISFSNTTSVIAKAINFTGVNQTTATAKILTASNNNQVTSASLLYSPVGTQTVNGEFVIDLIGTINQAPTDGASQINIWSGTSGAQERTRAGYKIATGSSTSMSYNFGNSSFAYHAFVINGVTGSTANTYKKTLAVINDGIETTAISIQPLEITANAGITNLDLNSNSKIRVTGSVTHTIKLPSALRLTKGKEYRVINKTTTDITIQDNAGTLLFTVKTNLDILFQLTDNGTIAGTWEQLNITPTSSVTESQYIRITPTSGVNTWDANRRMQFNQVVETLGSNITLSSTGILRLGSAGTYELIAVWQGSQSSGGGNIRWYNETSGAFVGQETVICPADSANTSTPNSVLYHTITITSPTNFSVRDTGGGNLQPRAANSYIIARQLNVQLSSTGTIEAPVYLSTRDVSTNNGNALQTITNSTGTTAWNTLAPSANRIIINNNLIVSNANLFTIDTNQITIKSAGAYLVQFSVDGANTTALGSNVQIYTQLVQNGTVIAVNQDQPGNVNNYTNNVINVIVNCLANDVLDFRINAGSGTPNIGINSYNLNIIKQGSVLQTVNDVPTGTIIQNVSPNIGGYLLCNGGSYNRGEYSALFNLLNTERGICTIAISTPAVITLTNHGLTTGQKVYFTTTGALPTGLSANTTYWVNVTGTNTFNLATSYANLITATYINTSGTQSGVHTVFLTIGNVSSATTFNVPDYQGKVLANASAAHGAGKFTGAETHTLTINEMPSHNHSVQGFVDNSYDKNDIFSNNQGLDTGANRYSTDSVGGGQPHNNMQPTEFVYFHIKF